jgi:hypothetical protein
MRRFKSGWVLVAVGSLAIGMAIMNSRRDVRWRKLSEIGRRDLNEGRSEKGLGREHPEVAESLDHLDIFYGDRGRDVEAKRLSKRALSTKEKSLAANQPETAVILKQFAPLLSDSGQAAQVEDPKTRKQPIRIKTH